jgi:homoserine dehydrogenase
VITANKEVISKHKKYFFKLAKKNGVDIYFEAAVGGGIPIIRSLKVGFAANKITAFYGILNGTTNYILTKLDEETKSYEEVLKNAQSLGFAEADPTMDVSGMDAAYKCTILAAVAFKIDVQVGDIYCEGIDKLSLGDFEYAKEFGFKIKLLAFGKRDSDDTFQLSVYPTMIPKDHPLAHVRNEYNAVYIVGDQVGDALLLGKGAGGAPTGSAIVSDIIDCAFGVSQPVSRRNLETHFIKGYVTPFEKTDSQFFLRLLVSNETGVLEKVTRQFSKHHVNIEKITQRETKAETAELVIVTQKISEKNCLSLVADLKKTAAINSVISKIRVLKL